MNPLICLLNFGTERSTSEHHYTKQSMNVSQLEELLNSPATTTSTHRRLFVIQTPGEGYDVALSSKLRNLLRTRLNVPAGVFHAQRWNQTTFRFSETINCPKLPTTTAPRRKFSLEYFEMWDVVNSDFFGHHIHDASTVKCAATGRQIQCHKWSTTSGWLLIAPRKCSFWLDESHNKKDGMSPVSTQIFPCSTNIDHFLTAVVLCDPPPTRVIANGVTIELDLKAFEGGYHGFIPDEVLGAESEAPPHTSLFGDLVYYVQNHADVLNLPREPGSAAMFLRKIVASHYCELLGFVSHQTAAMRSSGWAVQRRTQQEIDESNQVEAAWSHFKCPEYVEALSTVLDSLGISQGHDPYDMFEMDTDISLQSEQEDSSTRLKTSDWRSSTPDFLYLHREFRLRLADYARMTSSLAALNGMIGGRISILEARTARSLTLVAMLFAPPACVASIFSIPSDVFGQAGPPFWWYWAAAVPLTILVFLLTYLVHERDVVRRVWHARRPRIHHGQMYDDASAKV